MYTCIFALQELAPSRIVPPNEPIPLFPSQRGAPALPVGKLLVSCNCYTCVNSVYKLVASSPVPRPLSQHQVSLLVI